MSRREFELAGRFGKIKTPEQEFNQSRKKLGIPRLKTDIKIPKPKKPKY